MQRVMQPPPLILLVEHFYHPQKEIPYPWVLPILLSPHPLTTTNTFSVSMDLPTLDTFHISEIIQYVLLLDLFQSACFQIHPSYSMFQYFILFYGWMFHCMYRPHFVCPFTSWWTFLALMNKDTMNTLVQVFVWMYVFASLGLINLILNYSAILSVVTSYWTVSTQLFYQHNNFWMT